MTRCHHRRSCTRREYTTLVLFFIVVTFAANLWQAMGVEGERTCDKLGGKGKAFWEKVDNVNKAKKEMALKEMEEKGESQHGMFLVSPLKERLMKLYCDGIHPVNIFTVDAEDVAMHDLLLHHMEVVTQFEDDEKESDVLSKVPVRLEMGLNPPLLPEKVVRCVSYGLKVTPQRDHTDNLLITLWELTLDVGKREVKCQGPAQVFAAEQSFLELVDENGKVVSLETVEHQIIQGNVTLTAILPPGNDVLGDIRGIFCTLRFAKYNKVLDGWEFLSGMLWGILFQSLFSLFPVLLLPRRHYFRQRYGRPERGEEQREILN